MVFEEQAYHDHFITHDVATEPEALFVLPIDELERYSWRETYEQDRNSLRIRQKLSRGTQSDVFARLQLAYL
ncbi:MAG: hypothetical protein H6765_02555 [Candidatus Peribacteria bacterium]|nr:MAG: hypothetical protein H6765_02555 [Candidatus Peribacteria bacterium]